MIRSLVVLTRFRISGLFRRWKRSLGRPKGLLITIVLALLVVPWLGFTIALPFVTGRQPTPAFVQVDRFGALALFGMTLLSVLTSSGETAIYFSPAEVDFLFTGPYTRRQLIGYKLILALLSTLSSALLFALIGSSGNTRFGAAVVALVLVLMLFQLTQMVIGLALNVVGSFAWSRFRRGLLVAVAILIGLALYPSRQTLEMTDWRVLALTLERSPVTQAVLTPFGWFVRSFFAPDLATFVAAAVPALLTDLALVGMVFALDASYLEVSAASSAKRLAKVRKMVGGGGTIKFGGRRSGWLRVRPPSPSWWGGVGPNFWRQMVSALGDPQRIIILALIFGGGPYLAGSILVNQPRGQEILLATAPSVIVPATLFLSLMLAYDFRGDLDVMETLKMLPIRPAQVALGQILTPTVLATLLQAIAAGGLLLGVGGLPGQGPIIGLGVLLLFPANLYFFAIENLMFLWYPSRPVAGQFDGAAVVRQLLMLLVKGVAILIAAVWAAAIGAGAYFLAGRRLDVGLVAANLALSGLALGLIPLLGHAFRQFDVSHDVPA